MLQEGEGVSRCFPRSYLAWGQRSRTPPTHRRSAAVGNSPGLPAPKPRPGRDCGGAKQAGTPCPQPAGTRVGSQPPPLPVLGSDVGHDVLVEELQDERDAVGKDQMLGHVLKLGRKAGVNGDPPWVLPIPKAPRGAAGPWPASPGRCDSA